MNHSAALRESRPADKGVHGENFPVALSVLPARHRQHLLSLYRYARLVDTLGDEAVGDRAALLDDLAADVRSLYRGDPVGEPAVACLAPLLTACDLPIEPLLDLIRANRSDQVITRYPTFDDLLDYCRYSADPVGVLVLHVFGCASQDRIRLSNRICTALQLIEHAQDIGEDHAAGRVYLPQQDLARYGVAETELSAQSASPALRALLAFETERALAWLNAGAVLSSTVRGWARLAISGFVAGGRAAADRLRSSDYNPLPLPPKPRGRDIAVAWATATMRLPG